MLVRLLLFIFLFNAADSYSQKIRAKKGAWLANLALSEKNDLPFEMIIEKEGKSYSFTVVNGEEKILLSNPSSKEDSISISFPYFNSALIFKSKRKSISGYWHNYDKGINYKIPFDAKFSYKNRFNISNESNSDRLIDGNWKSTFMPNTDDAFPAVGVFTQPNTTTLLGTFLTETGDYRFLAGNTTNDSLFLSCFDGSHAFLFKASRTDSTMNGQFYSGNHWSCDWIAEKNDTFQLPDPTELTYVVDEAEFHFEAKDLNGNDYSFPNKQSENKVVIIQIMGTWCPNCLDETLYFKELYAKHHNNGLEIISVGFERGTTFEEFSANISRLKNKLNLDFTFLVGGDAGKNTASDKFSMLNEIISFPTAILINRKGEIVNIHTGFNGPGTGAYYAEYVAKMNALIETLIAE